jgi:chemotaxis protein methyltransferase CheR
MTALAHVQPQPTLGAGMTLSDKDFQRIAAVLFEDSGIHLPQGKASLVYSRLARRLRALGLESFHDYCDLVCSQEGVDERQAMLSALTTNVTRFFREGHHFTDLAKQIRTQWGGAVKAGGRLRIWSAGCSSGEEPYSMALAVLSELPDAQRYDVRILATDIDERILERARAGVYSAEAVEPIPAEMRNRWMDRQPDDAFSVGSAARDMVVFRPLNLMSAWPMKGRFNAIFCRNVAIYFDPSTQARLWERFAPLLDKDGRLYVGHSERVADKRFQTDGLTAYRLAGGA